ncbi:MAG TPA: CoA-binding protein [Balneolaceae bacterium]|nr:CoA-binding protein [Balneolaceae bacterium]
MDTNINSVLKEGQTIAVIGCSKKKFRTSYQIAEYLQGAGYTIIPVHPDYKEVLGEKAYASLTDISEDITVDIVDIFRNKKYTADMVDDVIKWKDKTGQTPVIWTQLDVSSPEAQEKAKNAGLPYIKNRCMMVEHKKWAIDDEG